MSENEEFKYGVKKEIIQKRIADYDAILLNYAFLEDPTEEIARLENELETIRKEESKDDINPEMKVLFENIKKEEIKKKEKEISDLHIKVKAYLKAKDVINELKRLIADSKAEYSFVEIEQIEKRCEFYKNILNGIDIKEPQKREEKINSEIEALKEKLENLKNEPSQSFKYIEDKNERQERIEKLKDKIASRRAVMVAYSHKFRPEKYTELDNWEKELKMLESGEVPINSNQEEIEKIERAIAEKENELKDINRNIKDLNEKTLDDIDSQKRYLENNIEELYDLASMRELFKINEKGEIEIQYPAMGPEIDEDAIKSEYELRKKDMLDKFYGNREKAKEYKERIHRLAEHTVEKTFKFTDEKGKECEGTYTTIEQYEELKDDISFLQLEEIVERLERLTKAEAGDPKAYEGLANSAEARKKDKEYIETNNYAYNRLKSTKENLMTLGKYGEKVTYYKFKEKQYFRNVIRAIGNAGKFLRNNITAPINKFVGSKIVSPIYGYFTNSNNEVAGLYSNKRSHRYVARRNYFAAQGKGYFSSRWNSIFNYKEANKAILSAGAHDIKESIIQKYKDMAQIEVVRKQTEFMSKSLDEQIEMIKNDIASSATPENIEKLEETLKDLQSAKEQVSNDREENERKSISQTVQTDAIDYSEHDIANKENVTRIITGVKILTRVGIRKFVGPKIKEWIASHTSKTEKIVVEPSTKPRKGIKNSKVEPIYDEVPDGSVSMRNMMASNAGKQIEGYYSVYAGEYGGRFYNLTGNEKITAIFKSTPDGGTGLSDLAGLKAPTFTNGTFASNLLDTNGVLNQDISIDTLLHAVGNGTLDPKALSGLYVSVEDKYWVKLSDLCSDITKQVKVGEKLVENIPTATPILSDTIEAAKVIDNKGIIPPLEKIGIASYNTIDGGLYVEDVYENTRKTNSKVNSSKSKERHYDYNAGFTGRKKADCEKEDNKEKDDNEER